jgi:hypothetical protein
LGQKPIQNTQNAHQTSILIFENLKISLSVPNASSSYFGDRILRLSTIHTRQNQKENFNREEARKKNS